ncbi:MAG TPA: hypothetical protein VHU81_15345 [Thermoanaerobaculia bacterium]|nr:hypothetical protein [Thermoanaerobaculia bacterium]
MSFHFRDLAMSIDQETQTTTKPCSCVFPSNFPAALRGHEEKVGVSSPAGLDALRLQLRQALAGS